MALSSNVIAVAAQRLSFSFVTLGRLCSGNTNESKSRIPTREALHRHVRWKTKVVTLGHAPSSNEISPMEQSIPDSSQSVLYHRKQAS